MTTTEAIAKANELLRANFDTSSTLYHILDDRTAKALAKLIGLATDSILGKRPTRLAT